MTDPLKLADASVEAGQDADPAVNFWTKEIGLAHKRELNFQKEALRITRLYEGDKKDENTWNILFANTQTLLPAVYNQLPRPFVDRRFKDADPLGKLAAKTLERTLSALEDSGDQEYDRFDTLLEQAVLGALVPGRGLTQFRYEAHITGSRKDPVDDREGEVPDTSSDKSADGTGPTAQAGPGRNVLPNPADTEKVEYECVSGDDLDYDRVVFGFARRWVHMPWVAHIHYMEKEDAIASFGKEAAELLTYADQANLTDGWKKQSANNNYEEPNYDAEKGSRPVSIVYEIWHKEKKEVVFFAPGLKTRLLKTVPDPYKLSGFYPFPEPLRFIAKRSKLTPTPLYKLYEEQAKELNRLTQRINRLLHALKVRGFYDGSLKGLKELLNSDDNTLIPASNVASIRDGQTIENSIWMVPVKDIVYVLQQLLPAREVIKNSIYEITGIADIMRGDTQASETATAQNIKNMYGTLKLNKYRKKVQDYARDCLRIMAELAGCHFSIDTFAIITNLDFAKPKDVVLAKKTIQYVQQQQMQLQAQAQQMAMFQQQQPPQPGQPPAQPQQPQLPPQLMQQAQQAMQVLQKPAWADIVGLLRNDLLRNYRIDIETNSTVASDTQEDKENINDALATLGTLFKETIPVVQSGALPMPAFKAILMMIVRRYSFGREVEDAISQMPDQLPQQGPNPQQLQQQQKDLQTQQQKVQEATQDLQQKGMDLQNRENELGLQKKSMDQENQMAKREIQLMVKAADDKQKLEHEMLFSKLDAMIKEHAMNVQTKAKEVQLNTQAATKDIQRQNAMQDTRHKEQMKMHGDNNKALMDVLTAITQAISNKGPRSFQLHRGPDGRMSGISEMSQTVQ